MQRQAITIRDVAREAGVSVATVSRALNGHANVAEPVRRLVHEVAQRLRYSPHGAARSLSSRSTQTIGVVLPDLHGEFFSELIRGIGAGARARRRHMLLSSYHGDREQQAAALRAMRGRVDGLLVMSPFADQPGFLEENLPPLPTVLVNTQQAEVAWPAFEIDNHAGAVAMTNHLLSLGHRRIAFIAGPAHNYDARERLRGFREAIAAHPGAQGSEYEGEFDEASGHRAGRRILAGDARPDAVFAANDMMALGCLYAFAQAGVRVPQDIALAGFDDIPLARFVHPSLTTMRVSIAQLGGRAVERLLDQIETGADANGPASASDADRQVMVPELVVRASCGGPEHPASGTEPRENTKA
ncbi:transcriptional regulator, LacI family [Pseudoxanthomonas suwonensis 11-1]|uniref:Transcriptional regulator, LacI family n=1 Tax=Pseudoxanthomonas suwonensis (strain 11-1) TaxID=743721 RepID=E6WSX3_PSEUU|nr:LacI family DNA-binding transcriptional regulator [Pseudoxanthomonas suwonensis]ADV27129.1 transcriptional regulator, LacI family [Pseudoxanthomonas suwonensis 11-1]